MVRGDLTNYLKPKFKFWQSYFLTKKIIMKNVCMFMLVILTFWSCDNEKTSSNSNTNVQIFDLENCTDGQSDSLKIKELKYIPLETRSECLMSSINKMLVKDNKIYILDNDVANSIFVFSLEGKFIYKINKPGKGPGEYLSLIDFDVDKFGNIFVNDQMSRKIIKYSNNGANFLEISNTDLYYLYLNYVSDSLMIFEDYRYFTDINNQKEPCGIVYWNPVTKKVVDRFFPLRKRNYEEIARTSARVIWNSGEKLSYLRSFSDTIYELQENGPIAKYAFKFPIKRLPFSDLERLVEVKNQLEIVRGKYGAVIDNFYETDEYLFMNFSISEEMRYFYYKKNEKRTYTGKALLENQAIMTSINVHAIYDDYFISVIRDEHLALYLKEAKSNAEWFKNQFGDESVDLLKSLPDDTNPILVMYKLP